MIIRQHNPSSEWKQRWTTVSAFVQEFPQLRKEPDLMRLTMFANILSNVLRYCRSTKNFQRILTICACLAEGPSHTRIITGSCQCSYTAARVKTLNLVACRRSYECPSSPDTIPEESPPSAWDSRPPTLDMSMFITAMEEDSEPTRSQRILVRSQGRKGVVESLSEGGSLAKPEDTLFMSYSTTCSHDQSHDGERVEEESDCLTPLHCMGRDMVMTVEQLAVGHSIQEPKEPRKDRVFVPDSCPVYRMKSVADEQYVDEHDTSDLHVDHSATLSTTLSSVRKLTNTVDSINFDTLFSCPSELDDGQNAPVNSPLENALRLLMGDRVLEHLMMWSPASDEGKQIAIPLGTNYANEPIFLVFGKLTTSTQ